MSRNEAFIAATKSYVCVEINRANNLDFNLFASDYDLTTSFVLGNADGTVYHRYGGRDDVSPMYMKTLVQLLKDGVKDHREYMKAPASPRPLPPVTMNKILPRLFSQFDTKVANCNHCHYINQAKVLMKVNSRKWTPADFWIYPRVEVTGLSINQNDEMTVEEVLPDSPADETGLEEGDKLVTLAGKRVRTIYDVQWILHNASNKATKIPLTYDRDDELIEAELELGAAWKVDDPAHYDWRVRNGFTRHMRVYMPAPGVRGSKLDRAELKEMGLDPGLFALRIERLILGPYAAGLRRGDVIVGASKKGKKKTFSSAKDFYLWFEKARLKRKTIKVSVFQDGSERTVTLRSKHLNYKPEFPPDPPLGIEFSQGKRKVVVSYVVPKSEGAKAGLQRGDVLVRLAGKKTTKYKTVVKIFRVLRPRQNVPIELPRDGRTIRVNCRMD